MELSYYPKERLLGFKVEKWNKKFLENFIREFQHAQEVEDDTLNYILHDYQLNFRLSADEDFFHVYIRNPEFKIFGEKVIGKRKEDMVELMRKNGFEKFVHDKDFGVSMLEFEEAGLTFFFENQFIDELAIEIY
ncbi:MAG: hypothetical protein N3F09_06035 [Bacteroidia bacterium]|nr:hypothetical protein [Bacteroidia bacterium]